MKHFTFFILTMLVFINEQTAFSQLAVGIEMPPNGGNPKASVGEEIGITNISINYSRPDVNKREGNIWGKLVPYGFSTLSFINFKPVAPWRGGANENSTISFEHDVKVEGKYIKAGVYGLHFALYADSCIVIFNKVSNSWGSFYYDSTQDALRVTVVPVKTEQHVEFLKYEFFDQTATSATIALLWEKLKIPFKIWVDVDEIVINNLKHHLTGLPGFTFQNWLVASQYCLNKNIHLDLAEDWAKRAITGVGSRKLFITLNNLANVYRKVNKNENADSVMKEALPLGSAAELLAYGQTLISLKRTKEAMEVFNYNFSKFGDVYAANHGLAIGYSASGDYTKAIIYAEKALLKAPNPLIKNRLEDGIVKLKEGKDMNQ